VAHHITQRGTGRQIVFRTRADRLTYLSLLREQAGFAGLPILAYCLMGNHIHIVAVPSMEDSLAKVMQRVHGRYAQYYNARRARCRHLWQNRYSSCPLGPAHLWAALRYVEMNPVRAGLVERPGQYEWSSAEGHLSGQDRWRIVDMRFWREAGGAAEWQRMLEERRGEAEADELRRATYAGQPFGDESFVNEMQVQRKSAHQAVTARDALNLGPGGRRWGAESA
jgi:putative transposase